MPNFIQNKENESDQKEMIISSLVILVCLALLLKLPTLDFFQETCKEIFFLAIVPIFYIKLILGKSLKDFGLGLPQEKSDFLWAGGVFLTYLIIFFGLIKLTDFSIQYHIPKIIQGSFGTFLFYELITFNFLFLLQEFFFKGFVLFSFSPKFKNWSILITALLYGAMLFMEKAFIWQVLPLILFSLVGSWLVYKNRSIWPAYVAGLASIILLDSFLIFISK